MFHCEICSKKFTRKDALRRHVSSLHGQKRYQCEICLKKFNRKDNVIAHEKNVHNSTPSRKCSKCRKPFTKPYHLNRHVLSCSKCRKCEVQFDSITEYNLHRCQKKHATPTECPGVNEPPTKRTKFNDVIQSSPPLCNTSSINNSPPLSSQRVHEDTALLSTDPGVNQPPSKIKKVKTFVKRK